MIGEMVIYNVYVVYYAYGFDVDSCSKLEREKKNEENERKGLFRSFTTSTLC